MLEPIPLRQVYRDGRFEPSSPPHDRRHDRPQSVAGDATILHSAVSKFSRYFGRSPDRLELEDVRAFQVHLVSTGISWPALNQIVCAPRFFYGVTLGEALIPERILYARERRKLPVVLSADEVVQFLEAVSSLKSRAALTTAYAAGLRASEVAGLRIEDIDSARGVIQVRHGKGAKDRNVMRSPQLLASCAPTGGSPGRGFICSLVVTKIIRSIRRCCTPPVGRR